MEGDTKVPTREPTILPSRAGMSYTPRGPQRSLDGVCCLPGEVHAVQLGEPGRGGHEGEVQRGAQHRGCGHIGAVHLKRYGSRPGDGTGCRRRAGAQNRGGQGRGGGRRRTQRPVQSQQESWHTRRRSRGRWGGGWGEVGGRAGAPGRKPVGVQRRIHGRRSMRRPGSRTGRTAVGDASAHRRIRADGTHTTWRIMRRPRCSVRGTLGGRRGRGNVGTRGAHA